MAIPGELSACYRLPARCNESRGACGSIKAEAEAVSMRIIGPTFVAVAMGYREIGNAQIAPPHRYCSEQAGGVARPHHLS